MFRRLRNIYSVALVGVLHTLATSYTTWISSIHHKVSQVLCDLTIIVSHVIPCDLDILQFSNKEACISETSESGPFLFHTNKFIELTYPYVGRCMEPIFYSYPIDYQRYKTE